MVLVEGGRSVVQVLGVSEEGLVTQDGSETVVIAWETIKAESAYDAMRKAADTRDAKDWIWIGIKMLERDEEKLADRAFTVAGRQDDESKKLATRAKTIYREGNDPRVVLNRLGGGGEADAPPSKPGGEKKPSTRRSSGSKETWPVLSDDERQQAIDGTLPWAQAMLDKAGVRIAPVESEHYMVFAAGGGNAGRVIARSLEGMHRELKNTFQIPDETVMYHGKCVVIILDSKPAFEDFEDRVFGNDAEYYSGFHHGSNTYSCVVSYSLSSPQALENLLVHETTHAFMHRYRTRHRLPTWANEGLADYIAGRLVPQHGEAERHWSTARTFVMNGFDPADVMAQDYGSGWNEDEYSYPVSHMIVRYMIKYKAPEFRAWIDDIKDGKQWVEAMVDRFSPSPDRPVTPDVLAQGFVAQMKSERTYQR